MLSLLAYEFLSRIFKKHLYEELTFAKKTSVHVEQTARKMQYSVELRWNDDNQKFSLGY